MNTSLYVILLLLVLVCVAAVVIFRLRHRGPKDPTVGVSAEGSAEQAAAILKAVGGRENVASLDYCTTRLRFELKSYSPVNEAELRQAEAENIIRPAKTVCQVVVGGRAQFLYDEMKKLL